MKTILFADDIPASLDLFEAILQRAECRFLRAEDGPAALATARRERPDLVYLDIEMPHLKGDEVCRILKAELDFAKTPVVLVSARDGEGLAAKCGADLFLKKPVDEPQLLSTLERFLSLLPRKEPRRSVDWPITFWREGSSHNGRIRDLSRTGFFMESKCVQAVGARLAITFPIPREGKKEHRTFVGEAIVVRSEQESAPGMGCRFFRSTGSGQAALEAFLGRES
jgi:CheY-like chemotaxis protein